MIPIRFGGKKPAAQQPSPTIEGWLMGGPDDGCTVNVGIEQTKYVTWDNEVYLRRPRVEDVINHTDLRGPQLIAAWFDHIEPA